MKKLILALKFKDLILNTKSFFVFEGDEKYIWNRLRIDLLSKVENSFFLPIKNDYEINSGWYVNYEDIEPSIDKLKLEIMKQDMKHIPHLMYNYNRIVEFIKSEVDCDLESLKKCKIHCFFKKDHDCLCCNAEQDKISPDNSDCIKFMIPDYYEQLKAIKSIAENKIEKMNLQELQAFVENFSQDK